MITLYGFGPLWGLPDLGQFVTKVDIYLRMAELSYKLEPYSIFALDQAPKGKLPFIEDDGERIADSNFIIEHLQKKYGDKLDAHLSAPEKAVMHAMRRMIDENVNWVLVQIRWRLEENWKPFMAEIFTEPEHLEQVAPQVRESVLKQMWGQGMERHSVDEVWHIGKADMGAIADYLDDKPFMMGDRPTSIDASVYSFLIHLQARFDSPIKSYIESRANLMEYCARMKSRFYGD